MNYEGVYKQYYCLLKGQKSIFNFYDYGRVRIMALFCYCYSVKKKVIVEICFNKIYLVEETNNCLAVSSRLFTDRRLWLVHVLCLDNCKQEGIKTSKSYNVISHVTSTYGKGIYW